MHVTYVRADLLLLHHLHGFHLLLSNKLLVSRVLRSPADMVLVHPRLLKLIALWVPTHGVHFLETIGPLLSKLITLR